MKRMLFLILIIGFSFAQKRGASELSIVFADTVNNGWVVADGKLLKKPYIFLTKNDTLYINDIQISPPLPDLDAPKLKVLRQTDIGKEFLEANMPFNTRCGELYAEWYYTYGEKKADEMTVTLLDTQKVIPVREYELGGGNLRIVYDYTWDELYEEVTPLLQKTYFETNLNLCSWIMTYKDKRTEKEKRLEHITVMHRMWERMIAELRHGNLLIFIHGGEVHIPSDRADSLVSDVRTILHTSLPDSIKIKKIGELLMLLPKSAAEIIKNKESWESVND